MDFEEARAAGVAAPEAGAVVEAAVVQGEGVAVEDEGIEVEEGDVVVPGSIPLVSRIKIPGKQHISVRFRISFLIDISDSESGSGSEGFPDEDSVIVDSESDEEDEGPTVKPYMALMQSFSETAAPKAKRRKLSHGEVATRVEESESGESDAEDDEQEEEGKDLDFVEPEGEDEAADEIPDAPSDDDDEEDPSNPFEAHFSNPDETLTSKKVAAVQGNQWATSRSVTGGSRVVSMYPSGGHETEPPAAGSITKPDSLKLKQRLRSAAATAFPKFDDVQRDLAPALFNYQDIFYCQRTVQNSQGLRTMTCLHALNHVLTTRDRVLKNNAKLAKEGEGADLELRDQGFTRPKVLYLLPTREACVRVVDTIVKLYQPDQQENRKRFDDAYLEKGAPFGGDRPADFKDLFDGNDDDMFRMGVMFTRKTMKFFAPFYRSDIILASPLGLRMAIGSEEDGHDDKKKKKAKMDFDFLSSIELVTMDQTDALLMQNWEHVEFIFEHLNLHPRESHDYDISRVRNWYLENWAKQFRQTIVLSAFNTPELSELMRLHCHNWAGKIRFQGEYAGEIQQLGIKMKQTFSRIDTPSIDKDPEARFEYFLATIVPFLTKRAKDISGVLLFIPSYLDFVRVRNYFVSSTALASVSFGAISEYADVPEASRARSHFITGRHRVLLYTERAHHFRRYQFKGVKSVIMYSLPDNPIFYKEITGGYLSKSEQDTTLSPGQGSVRVLFSKYDAMKLERIVGSQRVGKMLTERGDTFDFV
ncbi:related to U3 small nucleolar RNA-associated protein 25 [Cephalotrichum gorgonifer]|uniref:U3 small nucleolar RNA-associated protein 25 n=1 Tax=Cephalotrichum gorgonifer TaxID=2041049 RepID=A0AAE8N5N6_9PEZI|nr:related to U3 small nucleolar RNA-associated protein 25 [Cephalotrichum gorgonifer]